jgi:hypothetical protein
MIEGAAPNNVTYFVRKASIAAVLEVAKLFPVFPCKLKRTVVDGVEKHEKVPLIKGWADKPSTASQDPTQIVKWWTQWPDALVGIPTGSTSRIIAVDYDGPEGLAWFKANRRRLPTTQINRTNRGGHLLFEYLLLTKSVRIGASKIAPSIDHRGDGGFIVWWPAHGHKVKHDEKLADAPDWLVDEMAEPDSEPGSDDPLENLSRGRTRHTAFDVALVLDKLDPDMSNDGWVKVGMGTRHQLGDEGFPIYDGWSARAQKTGKYLGTEHVRKRWNTFDDDGGVTFRTVLKMVKDLSKKKPNIQFRHLAEIVAEKREPEWLLLDVLEANVLAVLVGPRGSFKSFIAFDWAMRAAMAGEGVVILSGEGAGIDRRADAWMRTFGQGRELKDLNVIAYEGILRLTQKEILDELAASLSNIKFAPRLLLIDTLSKYSPGLNENDNSEVAEFLSGLAVELRDAFKQTVLLVAHTGHENQGRIRGAYTLAANPDAEYVVKRKDPQGMEVEVSRDRFKDTPSLPPLRYTASSVNLHRDDKQGRPVSSLILEPDHSPPVVEKAKSTSGLGGNQKIVFEIIQGLLDETGAVQKMEVLNKAALRISRKAARQAIVGLRKNIITVEGGLIKMA